MQRSGPTTATATTLRTHTCGQLRLADAGLAATLCGWVQRTRDFGKFIFIDLRDRHGITQLAIDKDVAPALYEQAKAFGREFVLQASGQVRERENKNPHLPTGDIELVPQSLAVLNPAELPPFKIENDTDGAEELRLQYRYLDLRRPAMAEALVLRAQMAREVRRYLDAHGFLEIETPFFIKSTPEGARDFLVPSRLHPGTFYALPQSPQILKQLLMVSGMDRYYQITKCFRDEDFRGDRQPEFTQIDCEMSFVTQEDVLTVFGGLVQRVFSEIHHWAANTGRAELAARVPHDVPVTRISYREAMLRYGSDKPDLRFGMPIVDLKSAHADRVPASEFGVFNSAATVAGICAQGCAAYSRKDIDALTDFVKAPHRGAKGLAWIKLADDGTVSSSIGKFFDEVALRQMADALEAQPGDLVLLVADTDSVVRKTLGDLRLEIANRQGLRRPGDWSVFWVVDFPMFEQDHDTGAILPVHHPFVAPHPEDAHLLDSSDPADLLRIRAYCYDLVMNGNEILSGSIRIHDRPTQDKIFQRLGLTPEEKEQKFGFLLRAFEYGAPPHGGCAFGLDRWVMLFAGADTIRDVIAFPKSSSGRDLMLDAPAPVPAPALKELHIGLAGV